MPTKECDYEELSSIYHRGKSGPASLFMSHSCSELKPGMVWSVGSAQSCCYTATS